VSTDLLAQHIAYAKNRIETLTHKRITHKRSKQRDQNDPIETADKTPGNKRIFVDGLPHATGNRGSGGNAQKHN
jgi:hypothetical protein